MLYVKMKITKQEFYDQLKKVGNHFSAEGSDLIYNYLEEEIADEPIGLIEFDPVDVYTEYDEYTNLEALKLNYPQINSMEDLENATLVLKGPHCIVIKAF